MRTRRAFTLGEVLVAAALFGLLLALLAYVLQAGLRGWHGSDARHRALGEARKAQVRLLEDLKSTSRSQIRTAIVSGGHGQALWFPSALDPHPTSATFRQTLRDPSSGEPAWQSTILYYLTLPDHASLGLPACQLAVLDARGLNTSCPHKLLIRKVLDLDPAPSVDGTPGEEQPPASVDSWLTLPTDPASVSAMEGEAGLAPQGEGVRLISAGLLYLHLELQPGLATYQLQTFRLAEAQKTVSIGAVSLTQSPFTVEFQGTVAPGNP